MTVIQICTGGADGKNYEGIIKMLDVLLSADIKPGEKKRVLQEEFDGSMTEEMESEAESMCNLSQGIEDRAVDRTKVDDIISIMESLNVSEEQAMDALKVSSRVRSIYHDMIADRQRLQMV